MWWHRRRCALDLTAAARERVEDVAARVGCSRSEAADALIRAVDYHEADRVVIQTLAEDKRAREA